MTHTLPYPMEAAMHRVNLNQERFNQQVFDHASFGIALVGPEGVILTVNPAIEQIFGYSTAEFDGMRLEDLSHTDDDFRTIHQLKTLMGDRTNVQLEKRFISKNGDDLWGCYLSSFSVMRRTRHCITFAKSLTSPSKGIRAAPTGVS